MANVDLDQLVSREALGRGRSIRWVEGPCWYTRDSQVWGVVGRACECCVCATSTELDQLAKRGPLGWVRGPRMWAGVPDIHPQMYVCL